MFPIDHFRHCPSCGSPTATGLNPLRCTGCAFTYYCNPTVSAGAFLSDGSGRWLVIRREKDPGQGLLGIPGGFIDLGEGALEALRREVREEVGLEIVDIGFLGSFPNIYLYKGVSYPVCDLLFTARAVQPELARELDGVAGLEWRTIESLQEAEFAFESMKQALRELKR